MIERLIESVLQHYEKGPEFFISSNKYISYAQEMSYRGIKLGDLVSVSLECSGHGSFRKKAVAMRFLSHLAEVLQYNPNIRHIKLKISGFDLSEQIDDSSNLSRHQQMSRRQINDTLINAIIPLIGQRVQYLTSLQIRVSNVTNCSMDDFKTILQLGVNQSARQLTNLSCEFSDWAFKFVDKDGEKDKLIYTEKKIKKADHDRNGQPNMQQFLKMLNQGFENTLGMPMLDLKKFRLQISTWYYSDFEMQKFFFGSQTNKALLNLPKNDKIPQRIQYFHNEFKSRVEAMILIIMPGLNDMQLDLRNWNRMFEMGILKTALLNISNQQRQNSMSQISKRQQKTKVLSKMMLSKVLQQPVSDKKTNQKLKQLQAEQEKQQYFDFSVVI